MFLNRERQDFPDIDTDVSQLRRSEVIQYIYNKYNKKYKKKHKTDLDCYELPTGIRVTQLENFTYIGVKNGLKGIMRAYDSINGTNTYQEVNELTRGISNQVEQQTLTPELFEEILFSDKDKWLDILGYGKWTNIENQYKRLQDFYSKYPFAKDGMDGIRGCITGVGLHAGAVIVSGVDLESYIPLSRPIGSAVIPIVSYNMAGASLFNLLKIDLLGLRTLSTFEKFMNVTGLTLDWYDSEDFSDTNVYETINQGFTTDGFQLCTNSAKYLLKRFKINNFHDMSAFLAGNRPGPLSVSKTTGKSMVDLYLTAKSGGRVNHIHPEIDKILSNTYGCMWYQEDLIKIGQIVAGYSLGNADSRIRATLGKKKIDKIPEIKNEFIYGKKSIYSKIDINNPQNKPKVIGISNEKSPYCEGAINRGFEEKEMITLFDNMADYAKYCFNLPHSGSYGKISYKTMWAKTYYPVEWALACLMTHGNDELVKETLYECRRMDIPILCPDINKSEKYFSVEENNGTKQLRFGLLNIKGVGETAADLIIYIRKKKGLFTSIDDFYDKSKSLKKDELNSLGLKINSINKKIFGPLVLCGAFDCFCENRYEAYNILMIDNYLTKTNSKTADIPAYNISHFTIKSKINLEKQLMGMYISEHILDKFPYQSFSEAQTGDIIETAGIILFGEIRETKKGDAFGKFSIENKFGDVINVMLFGDNYIKLGHKIFDLDHHVIKDKIVIVKGQVNKEYNNIACINITTYKAKRKIKEIPVFSMPQIQNFDI